MVLTYAGCRFCKALLIEIPDTPYNGIQEHTAADWKLAFVLPVVGVLLK